MIAIMAHAIPEPIQPDSLVSMRARIIAFHTVSRSGARSVLLTIARAKTNPREQKTTPIIMNTMPA